jgi:hypothetical protein
MMRRTRCGSDAPTGIPDAIYDICTHPAISNSPKAPTSPVLRCGGAWAWSLVERGPVKLGDWRRGWDAAGYCFKMPTSRPLRHGTHPKG